MFKLLRNHSKLLIAVFGSLLMIAFLLPQAMTQFGQNRPGAPVAKLAGRTVTAQQVFDAQQEFRAANAVAFPLFSQMRVENVEHWFLLTHEATRAGLYGGPRDADSLMQQAAEQMALAQIQQETQFFPNKTPEQRQQDYTSYVARSLTSLEENRQTVIREQNLDENFVSTALAKLQGVLRLQESYSAGSESMSINESLVLGRDLLDSATVDLVIIEGAAIESFENIDDARIAQHFAEYQSVKPGEGEHGIGYLRPPAVQIEWVGMSGAALNKAITLDPVAVYKFWEQNKAQFPPTFAEARPSVEARLRRERATQITGRFAEVVQRENQRSLATLPFENGVHALPSDWATKMPALDALALKAEAEILRDHPTLGTGATPQVQANTGIWFTAETLTNLETLSTSTFRLNDRQQIPFSLLLADLPEMGGVRQFGGQLGVIKGPLTSFDGSMYFVRVVTSRPESPPDGIDEVRDQITKDLKSLDGYRAMTETRDAILARAGEAWVGSIGLQYGVKQPEIGLTVTRDVVRPQPGVALSAPELNTPEFRNLIMDMVGSWDPKLDVSQKPHAERTVLFPMPKRMAYAAAQVQKRLPPTLEQYRQSGLRIMTSAARRDAAARVEGELSYASLAKRLRFVPIVVERDSPEGEAPATPAPEPASSTGG